MTCSTAIKANSITTCNAPAPPERKVSLANSQQQDNKQQLNSETASTNDDTICSEGSIGSITPTNPVQTEINLYRLANSNKPIEDKSNFTCFNQKQLNQSDDLTATLTRHNNKNKLSTSLKSVIFPSESNTLSYNQNQLSLINLNQSNSLANKNKANAPPPPIRRTSSISNPNAITLETLRTAGVSTYEEIKNLTLTNLNRFKKNTTNYATYEDVSRLGMSLVQPQHQHSLNQSSSNYATFSPSHHQTNLSHQDIYQYGFNTYAGNRSHYRISSCTNLVNTNLQTHNDKYSQQQQQPINLDALHVDLEKNEDKDKINQLRSEYQQAKHLFENLECNQQFSQQCNQQCNQQTTATATPNLIQQQQSQNDFQTYLNQQQASLESDSGCGSNSGSTGDNGSQTSNSSITGHNRQAFFNLKTIY